jgi:hypothetical protein
VEATSATASSPALCLNDSQHAARCRSWGCPSMGRGRGRPARGRNLPRARGGGAAGGRLPAPSQRWVARPARRNPPRRERRCSGRGRRCERARAASTLAGQRRLRQYGGHVRGAAAADGRDGRRAGERRPVWRGRTGVFIKTGAMFEARRRRWLDGRRPASGGTGAAVAGTAVHQRGVCSRRRAADGWDGLRGGEWWRRGRAVGAAGHGRRLRRRPGRVQRGGMFEAPPPPMAGRRRGGERWRRGPAGRLRR